MLIVPRKRIWTQQPQQAAQIDPLLSITGLWNFTTKFPRDSVSGVQTTASDFEANFLQKVGPVGLGVASASTTPRYINTGRLLSSLGISGSADRTIFGIAVDDLNADHQVIFTAGAPSTGQDWTLRKNGSASSWRFNVWGSTSIDFTYSSPSGIIAFVCRQKGTLLTIWINGKIVGSGTVAVSTTDVSFTICGNAWNGWASWQSPIGLIGVANKAWTEDFSAKASTDAWQIFRAPDSRIFVPTGAGAGGGDSLTASSIIASPATVGSPLLSQKHALSALSIASAPAVVASPAITQRHALSATAVSASPAVVGSPLVTQKHVLSATAILSAPAIVGSPTLTEIVAGILSALPIVAAPAVVGAPAIGQKHALSAGAISAGPATFGTPTLAQQHVLMAQGITAGAAVVGAPALTPGGAALFTPEQLAYILAYVEANMAVPTPAEISAAVLAALQASSVPFPANVKKVNDRTVVGQGLAPPNHWRPE